jgi:transposase
VDTFLPTKTGKQFLDFIKRRVDQKYDDSNIKQIFLVLDNISIHKSNNKVKETLARHHHPRIQLVVFLPTTRSTDLNMIEVRWIYGCT